MPFCGSDICPPRLSLSRLHVFTFSRLHVFTAWKKTPGKPGANWVHTLPLPELVLLELLPHLLEPREHRLGLEQVVQQAAGWQARPQVGQVVPRDALDERL